MNAVTQEAKAIAAVEEALKKNHGELTDFIAKANEEIKGAKTLSTETKAALDKLATKATELADRLVDLEQKGSRGSHDQEPNSFGAQFTKSDAFSGFAKGQKSGRLELKTAIVNATGASQPLVQAQRLEGVITPPQRRLTIRDLLMTGPTSSNSVEYARELVFTNNAGAVNGENVLKPESGITFELANAPVCTLAHWIPASRQVLDDAPMLASYIDTRMMYGLKLVEEGQILMGDGTAGKLSGIMNAGNCQTKVFVAADGTPVDQNRKAITLAQLSEYAPEAIVLHPTDLELIELTKDGQGRYVWVNPNSANGAAPWGLRAVVTTAIPAGTFLIGSFSMAAQVWDRQQAAIEVSRENSDNFVKNMVTILAEERLALTVYRPAAFVKGTFYKAP
jgi:HK97 family phage major capsid protein